MDQADQSITKPITAANPQNAGSAKDDAQPALPVETPHKHHKRSTGLRLFDVLLYPVVTNVGVFVISVGATYLTNKGNLTTKGRGLEIGQALEADEKLVHGKIGMFFQARGKWLTDKLKGFGLTESQADMGKMVTLSFADGSLMAPLVKLFEDRREKIGRWCDKKLGTTPDDPDAYSKEPKQSWLSVLGGRAATAAVVVNTAVALDKTGLNKKLFNDPGAKMGDWMKAKPAVNKFFGKFDVGELARVSLFEAFYTSVCTAGLYFTSRLFARGLNKHAENKEHQKEQKEALAEFQSDPATLRVPAQDSPGTQPKARDDLRKARPTAAAASHRERYDIQSQEPALMGR